MNRLVMSSSQWDQAEKHLLQNREGFVFFLCGTAEFECGTAFLVRNVVPIRDTDLELVEGIGLQMNLKALLRLTNHARKEGLSLVEAHSHPLTKTGVRFSRTDLDGLKEFVPYILNDLPDMPYAATVWGRKSIDGRCWKSSHQNSSILAEVRIVGENLTRIATTSSQRLERTKSRRIPNGRSARQVLALGERGQELMKQTSVAIIGLGGLGSNIAQLLAHLGVRRFTLVDFDTVEVANLNRLVGAGPNDLGKSKVDVAGKMIRRIAGKDRVRIQKLERDLRDPMVLNILKRVDVIFGCVDRNGPRLVLNELSLAYMTPYIDSAFGINVENDVIQEAGGRVILVKPDGPCLLCCKEIDIKAAGDDLASPEELTVRERLGYVNGADVPSPSVVSLDATIASVAVTELLALVTGFRPARTYTLYDLLEQKMVPRLVKPDPNCVACSVRGLGDKAKIERYAQPQILSIPSVSEIQPT